MRSTPLAQALVVMRKELRDWSRDRRSIITVLVSSLLAPGIIFFMFNNMASRQRQVEDVTIPVVGANHAPAFVDWLRQQAGVTIVEGPEDAADAVRTRREDAVLVIPENFSKNFQASKPAQVRLVADSSSQNSRPKVQRIRTLLQRYNGEIGSLRLIARGVSPAVATAVQIEDVEVSSSQQRAAMILGFIPLFVMLSAFTGAMAIATDSTAGERERGSIRGLARQSGAAARDRRRQMARRDGDRAGHRYWPPPACCSRCSGICRCRTSASASDWALPSSSARSPSSCRSRR